MGEGRVDDRDAVPSPASFGRAVRAFLEVRLLARYGAGLDLRFEAPGSVVARTEGVSASFIIKELLRWATLLAAEEAADKLVVTDRHVTAALDELPVSGGALTLRLLGGEPP